jgi:uncharacterized alkaline shock family protein YloU
MAQLKDNLPISTEPAVPDGGSITYANEVIAIISGIAASEIEGIAGMVTAGGLGEIISKNRNITRGVKVEVGTEEVSVDLYTIVEYGQPIQKVASEVQENVRKSIESMTGLRVVRVDIHVQGVSFEKDKQDAQSRLEAANVKHLDAPRGDRKSRKAEKEKAAEELKNAEMNPVEEKPAEGKPWIEGMENKSEETPLETKPSDMTAEQDQESKPEQAEFVEAAEVQPEAPKTVMQTPNRKAPTAKRRKA